MLEGIFGSSYNSIHIYVGHMMVLSFTILQILVSILTLAIYKTK